VWAGNVHNGCVVCERGGHVERVPGIRTCTAVGSRVAGRQVTRENISSTSKASHETLIFKNSTLVSEAVENQKSCTVMRCNDASN
jgi:hypothetical protein